MLHYWAQMPIVDWSLGNINLVRAAGEGCLHLVVVHVMWIDLLIFLVFPGCVQSIALVDQTGVLLPFIAALPDSQLLDFFGFLLELIGKLARHTDEF